MKILRDEEGQTLVMVALSLTVLLGFVGLATDVGIMQRQKRIAQSVADTAAIAAAGEAMLEGNPTGVTTGMTTAATHDITMAGLAPSTSVNLILNASPNISTSSFNTDGYVQAIVSIKTPTIFMSLFNMKSMTISASAIASEALQSAGCFNIQNGEGLANPAGTMGGNSELFGNNCGVTINGNLDMGGSSNINAKFVVASGGIVNGGSSSITGAVSQEAPPTPDPLPKLQQTANQPTIDTTAKTCTAPSGSGMSCIYNFNNGNLSGTLQSNTIYVFDSNVNSGHGPYVNGTVTGSGDTIYLSGNIPFDFDNNGSMNITPPGYGASCTGSLNPMCGVVINAPSDGANGHGTYSCATGKGNNGNNPAEIYLDFGSSTTKIEGVIYAPYMQMFVQDQGASTTLDTDVVIGNFCSQSATLKVNGYSASYSPLARMGLVY
jgi:hypothetical protein